MLATWASFCSFTVPAEQSGHVEPHAGQHKRLELLCSTLPERMTDRPQFHESDLSPTTLHRRCLTAADPLAAALDAAKQLAALTANTTAAIARSKHANPLSDQQVAA